MGLCLVVQTRPSCICLICDFCSSDREFALGLLQIPSHDGHPCPQLTLPTAMRVADFHCQVTAHFGQTKIGTGTSDGVTVPVFMRETAGKHPVKGRGGGRRSFTALLCRAGC